MKLSKKNYGGKMIQNYQVQIPNFFSYRNKDHKIFKTKQKKCTQI